MYSGTVGWNSFPSSIEQIFLHDNDFTGDISFSDMSSLTSLTHLIIDGNSFDDNNIEYSGAPDNLEYVWIYSNDLTGDLQSFDNLPSSLIQGIFSDNVFTGAIDNFSNLGNNITHLYFAKFINPIKE